MSAKARVIAFYLPQFHPIPENDKWWGPGFTEWTNVGKAKPLFKGHYQPRVPANLGYYDLRLEEVRIAQAELARNAGIEGFCYWHYWFGNGKRLLEKPFNAVLTSNKPDYPFCLAWANESWKGFDHGLKNRNLLIEQFYPGVEDYKKHFYSILPAFLDKRYITVEEKPIFLIYKPLQHPELNLFIDTWQKLAVVNGLKGIYFIGHKTEAAIPLEKYRSFNFDAINTVRLGQFTYQRSYSRKIVDRINKIFKGMPTVYTYSKAANYFITKEDYDERIYPTLISGWDHSPRSGKEGLVLTDFTPNVFKIELEKALGATKDKPFDHSIIFLKSWNEWGEGNYVEPDLKWGCGFLDVLKNTLSD